MSWDKKSALDGNEADVLEPPKASIFPNTDVTPGMKQKAASSSPIAGRSFSIMILSVAHWCQHA